MPRIIFLFLFLANCTFAPVIPIAIEEIIEKSDRKTAGTISSKLIEKPYQIDGKWFYPQDYDYLEEIGIAHILNDLTTGDKTRNGEIYHDEILMGSHRSLPLPSIVRVTNMSNGYSIRVRINHRGAFSNTNVVNLSTGTFDKLKLDEQGDLVKITLIKQNETFILNEAHTYDEEKKVIEAPISSVTIGNIDDKLPDLQVNNDNDQVDISLDGFQVLDNYKYEQIFIKLASFSFLKNAQDIVKKINDNHPTGIIEHLGSSGEKRYMVVIGPFKNIDNLLRILNDDTFDKYEDLSIFII